MGLSRRAYARHRESLGLPGSTDMAVRKAISSARISLEPDGTIDPARADREWAAGSDPTRAERIAAPAPEPATPRGDQPRHQPPPPKQQAPPGRRPVPAEAVEGTREVLREAASETPGVSFVQARTANEVIKAQERRVRLSKLKGELVDRSKAMATVFALARRERDSWLAWPGRVAGVIAAELRVDQHAVGQILEEHVRQHLDELSEVSVDLR